MANKDFVELTAFWGNDDVDSTIKISASRWMQIQSGAHFEISAKSHYEGQSHHVIWSFAGGEVSIIGKDGAQHVVGLPLTNLLLNWSNSTEVI